MPSRSVSIVLVSTKTSLRSLFEAASSVEKELGV